MRSKKGPRQIFGRGPSDIGQLTVVCHSKGIRTSQSTRSASQARHTLNEGYGSRLLPSELASFSSGSLLPNR